MGMPTRYRAIISSDWNECLAPCGPFDALSFNYPELASELKNVFLQYTGNRISLGEATRQIEDLLPAPVTAEQMDAYLDQSFRTYTGVPELISWCLNNQILFMINTTGMIGYFQRVFAKGLLPKIPVLSALPSIRFDESRSDPSHIYDLYEIPDKGSNTQAAVRKFGIPPDKVILMGDSGGDGPHFEWGAQINAFLIGCMTKPSLATFCQENGIAVNQKFGLSYSQGEEKSISDEMQIDFMELTRTLEKILKRP